jgi:nucleobase:cation symporter-1, NCS1 family
VPSVEEYGVEPIPAELRTTGSRDLFAINFTFFLNPVMYVLGAIAVAGFGLPLWWAILAMVLGQALAYAVMVPIAEVGVDYGLTGQVAARATLGFWGAAPAQLPLPGRRRNVLVRRAGERGRVRDPGSGAGAGRREAAARPCRARGCALPRHPRRARLRRDALAAASRAAALARLRGRDGRPVRVGRRSAAASSIRPPQDLTWAGFAGAVTLMAGSSLTLVTSVADFCRYTPTRRDVRIGLTASAVAAALVDTFVGGYAAAATGETNPFVVLADLTASRALLALLLVAIVVQGISANIGNVYTAGLSLVNTLPVLGRLRATILVAAFAVALSTAPDVIDSAQLWIVHLGNVAAPLAAVMLVDYVVVKRREIDIAALFDPNGPYRYLNGVNVPAFVAVGAGVGLYYALPQSWLKIAWGLGAAAVT